MKKVAIIGGGLAGLITSVELVKKGVPCRLYEKKDYPMQRVCGEYVSNEAIPFLKKSGLFPEELLPTNITQFQLSSIRGQIATMPLDLGGFGISRFAFDNFLYTKAKRLGVEILVNTEVSDVQYNDDGFVIGTHDMVHEADVVVGAFGKRSRLDVSMQRSFIKRRSPYIGVKYHATTDHPSHTVALHNFQGGYCGVGNVEGEKTNICYLASRDILKKYSGIAEMEKEELHKNPRLKTLFKNAVMLHDKPVVINEISFETKSPVEQHVLMAGDSAGMITPLCGNGMAIAIHTAKMVSELVVEYCQGKINRAELESSYARIWNKTFSRRLWLGRNVQRLFGNPFLSDISINMIMRSDQLARLIMKNTHGSPF